MEKEYDGQLLAGRRTENPHRHHSSISLLSPFIDRLTFSLDLLTTTMSRCPTLLLLLLRSLGLLQWIVLCTSNLRIRSTLVPNGVV